MRRGFTLVEMLIVVVVLVTLMSITFRLSSIGDDQTRRNTTVARLQRLENCLSGYYAAFGTYPPVKRHASRDYNLPVNMHGIQLDDDSPSQLNLNWYKEDGDHGVGATSGSEYEDWKKVRAACQAQPLAAKFPVAEGYNDYINALSELQKQEQQESSDTSSDEAKMVIAGYDDGYTKNPGRHDLNEVKWRESQLFQFGLLSYLLPRFLVMMNGDDMFFTKGKQWQANNSLPYNPIGTGGKFSSWSDLHTLVKQAREGNKLANASVANIPSQAACARWLVNLENSCYCIYMKYARFYGINIAASDQTLRDATSFIYAPGGTSGGKGASGSGQQYTLAMATVTDGWNHEFYYYSPEPHQSYVVWSAGANGRTFPPWVDRSSDDLKGQRGKCVTAWIGDDIMHMSN